MFSFIENDGRIALLDEGGSIMVWDNTVKLADVAIVFATMVGPVLAVQAQKWVERGKQTTERRRLIFSRLMATRATPLSPTHVEALNAIPIEFYGVNNVTDAWKTYLDHMNAGGTMPIEVWGPKRVDLFVDLLHRIAVFLRYNFNTVEIKTEIYSPKAHGEIQTDQEIIRRGVARLFSGDVALPIAITTMPTDPETRELILKWLKGETTLPVKVSSSGIDATRATSDERP